MTKVPFVSSVRSRAVEIGYAGRLFWECKRTAHSMELTPFSLTSLTHLSGKMSKTDLGDLIHTRIPLMCTLSP